MAAAVASSRSSSNSNSTLNAAAAATAISSADPRIQPHQDQPWDCGTAPSTHGSPLPRSSQLLGVLLIPRASACPGWFE